MTTFKNTLSYLAVSAALLFTASALASDADKKEHRQHGAHEHGSAKLTIVSEGKELLIELDSPAANILGFEHAPENDQQKALIVQARDSLSNINNIVTLPATSECVLEHVEIKGALFSQHQGDDDHKEHSADKHDDDDHKEHSADKHDNDDHKEHSDDKHDDDDHKEHSDDKHDDDHKEHSDDKHDDDHEEHSSHSDVSVHYELHCASPEKITTLALSVFDHFKDMKKIDVQAVVAEKQLAKQLTQKDNIVNF